MQKTMQHRNFELKIHMSQNFKLQFRIKSNFFKIRYTILTDTILHSLNFITLNFELKNSFKIDF